MGAAVSLIENDSLKALDDGYAMKVRLNWYRSLPLSCVEDVRLTLDGQPVEREALRFEINDHSYALDEMAELVEEFWFVQDFATLKVKQPGKVMPGATHNLDVTIVLRFPYIVIGPGRFLTNHDSHSATLTAAG